MKKRVYCLRPANGKWRSFNGTIIDGPVKGEIYNVIAETESGYQFAEFPLTGDKGFVKFCFVPVEDMDVDALLATIVKPEPQLV